MADTRTPPRERLWPGVLAWTAFSAVAVLARGVQWDENFEFAQTMTGQVPYPEGHPFKVYTLGAFNLQIYLSALVVYYFPSPIVLCAIRNFLFIFASTVPQFLLGAVIARRAIAGHVTALLFLSGIHLAFDGSYPLFVWPGMFSNGHIGTGYALICVALLVARRYAVGGFLTGLLPAVHLGQAPTVFVLLALQAATVLWRRDSASFRRLAVWFLAGASLSVTCYFVQRSFAAGPLAEGAYATQGDSASYWSGRISGHDMHRSIPAGNSHLVTVGFLLLSAITLIEFRRGRTSERQLWCAFYGLTIVAIVYSVMAFQVLLGRETPYLLLGWLPYRLYNHLPPLVLALLSAFCFRRSTNVYIEMVPLMAIVLPVVVPLVLDRSLPQVSARYFATGEWAMFLLYGAVVFAVMREISVARPRENGPSGSTLSFGREFIIPAAALLGVSLVLAPFHQFGAAMIVAGGLIMVLIIKGEPLRASIVLRERVVQQFAALTVIVAAATMFFEQANARDQLPVGSFEHAVAEYLNASGEPNAMLLSAPYQLLLQAQTGHPVLVDMATGFYGSYRPSLGGVANAIYTEIYGIDFTRPPKNQGPDWKTVWASRSPEDWKRLGARWGFRYVVARKGITVNLPVVRTVGTSTLHAVFSGPSR